MGERWVGPRGLLGLLETMLGLGGPGFSQVERAAALVPTLDAASGFWRQSFENDCFATAAALLRWRDELWFCGWTGQSEPGGRLCELAEVTQNVLPGYPDRLAAVANALSCRAAHIGSISRIEPAEDLPRLWALVFERLATRGTAIVDLELGPASSAGNLAAARESGFTPAPDDNSLQLLRPHGALDAAERVAAYLAGLEDLEGVVVVGADSVLDAALHRYGLPTTGSSLAAGGNALLQVIPLVLECGWEPADPQRVLELLTLPRSPVPRGIARGLSEALHKWPAVGSDAWHEAMHDGLARIDEESRRARVQERLSRIFQPETGNFGNYPASAIHKRLAMLVQWLSGMESASETGDAAWHAAITQCTMLKRLVELSGMTDLSRHQLRRLVGQATAEAPSLSVYSAEAGLSHVDSPGAVAGPATRVIWWGFTRDAVSGPYQLPLARDEKEELLQQGVAMPDPGLAAVCTAARWRRPLLQSRDGLVLVCPGTDHGGDELHPHPLWDEVVGNLAGGAKETCLVRSDLSSEPGLLKTTRALTPPPVAQRTWHTARDVPRRKYESPSSAGDLLGCSLKWVLNHVGKARGGATVTLSGDSMLWGSLVHHIISEVMRKHPADAAEARLGAETMFDRDAPRLAATLFLRGAEADRVKVRRVAGLAAESLCNLLARTGAAVAISEESISGRGLGGQVRGIPDLVVDNPARVIDLKWGSYNFRRQSLESGTAYQLAMYGHLARGKKDGILPGAYFILGNQRLLTVEGKAFADADVVKGPTASETWAALARGYKVRRNELSDGIITAEAIEDEDGVGPPEKSKIDDDGTMRLEPPCRFCDYAGLCGLCYEE